ncbi:MAG: nitroreductase family protein [Fuscovulum sp.]|nr:nitroreductase family protein [Fuscovulum sp.]
MTDATPPTRRPEHDVAPMFPARWSPRSLTAAPVTEAQVMTLLEAARWAPSASNHQPWRLVWALRGEPAFDAITAALVPFNQDWAGKAAALIVVASDDRVAGRDGTLAANRWAAFDSGAAWMALALQAEALGLVAHAMGGFDAAALAGAVALPEAHSLHAVVAVGHQGRAGDLPEGLRAREVPSPRKALAEIARRGRF